MASEQQPKKSKRKKKLDEEPYISMFKETGRLVHEALKKYGKPTISREELRELASRELEGELLSEFIVKERKSTW